MNILILAFNFLCITMMIFVHTFNNPAFILFWGVCLCGFYHTRQNKIMNFDSIKKHLALSHDNV